MEREKLSRVRNQRLWLLRVIAVVVFLLGFLRLSHANEASVITGQAELSTQEDSSLTIMLADLVVNDPANI
jgi:hypothetical protein